MCIFLAIAICFMYRRDSGCVVCLCGFVLFVGLSDSVTVFGTLGLLEGVRVFWCLGCPKLFGQVVIVRRTSVMTRSHS